MYYTFSIIERLLVVNAHLNDYPKIYFNLNNLCHHNNTNCCNDSGIYQSLWTRSYSMQAQNDSL